MKSSIIWNHKDVIHVNERFINTILLHSSLIDDVGLLNGKMGISILFYHLARETGNPVYEKYAGELIDEIYVDIGPNPPADFAGGLAGIGWGIEYLAQNHFLEAGANVLEEFDDIISNSYAFPFATELYEEIIGLGFYLLMRLQNPRADDRRSYISLKNKLLADLIDELNRRTQNITSILPEPTIKRTLAAVSETPDIKRKSKKNERIFSFDLTWVYPLLLVFLSKAAQLEVHKKEVNIFLERLVMPLLNIRNYPLLYCNRLLLALALTKVNREKKYLMKGPSIGSNIMGNLNFNEIEITIRNLLYGVNRNAIAEELEPDFAFLKRGTAGIAWIYQQLFKLTMAKKYRTEANFWIRKSYQGYKMNEERMRDGEFSLGLLNGVSGLVFTAIGDDKN